MRYVLELGIYASKPDERSRIRVMLEATGVKAVWKRDGAVLIRFEKSETQRYNEVRRLLSAFGHDPFTTYRPVFEPIELDQAELVIVTVHSLCGQSFAAWQEELGLPLGTRVMDKSKMGKRDLARTTTYPTVFVISERFREILSSLDMTGWSVQPVRHIDPARDRYPPLFELRSTNNLPPVATTEDFGTEEYPDGVRLTRKGPLIYWRHELATLKDINQASERFTVPFLVVSQRLRRVVKTHKLRGDLEFEPVLIRDLHLST